MPIGLVELGARKKICVTNKCGQWAGRCLAGHVINSDYGCPKGLFRGQLDPTGHAINIARQSTGVTWDQVLKQFATDMTTWMKAGLPLASTIDHTNRFNICKSGRCGRYVAYRCQECGCFAYVKSKLGTAKCPKQLW